MGTTSDLTIVGALVPRSWKRIENVPWFSPPVLPRSGRPSRRSSARNTGEESNAGPCAVARFNRRITNPLALSLGGWAPLQGTLEHVGRKSGKRYRTPLNIFDTDDGYVIPIGYGIESTLGPKRIGRRTGNHSQARQDSAGRQRSAGEQGRGRTAGGIQLPAVLPPPSLQRGGPGVDGSLAGLGDGEYLGAGQRRPYLR